MATWATLDDVFAVTRREVSEENLAVAQAIMEDAAGFDGELDDTAVSTRNARFLKRAVIWQAAWLERHPDAIDAMDVTGVSADGVSAQHASATAAYMAPMARSCLMKVSWKHAPIRVRGGRRVVVDTGNRDDAVRDDSFVWAPMGGDGTSLRAGGADPMSQRFGQVWS
jgi:hypothetical protein